MAQSPDPAGNGRFTVFAPVENDPTGSLLRFGLIDESGKLDVNGLLNITLRGQPLDELEQRTLLLGLPGMTAELADAILDYVDSDAEPREFGAEADAYAAFDPPRLPRDGPLNSVDELLLVVGVTPQLLYGEDANRNGLLDPAENDGAATLPFDNADGLLDVGWAEYLTVYGGEPNLRGDGSPKIDLNDGVLTDLYDALLDEFDEETARFVVAYRLAGPIDPENSGNTLDPNAPIEEVIDAEEGRTDRERTGADRQVRRRPRERARGCPGGRGDAGGDGPFGRGGVRPVELLRPRGPRGDRRDRRGRPKRSPARSPRRTSPPRCRTSWIG